MKEIRAYLQPFVLGRVVQALTEISGFPGVSVLDCDGFGHRKITSGQEFNPFTPKKRLEIIADDSQVEAIVAAIMKYAHTGRPGDGKILLFDVLDVTSIRTGEKGIGVSQF